jgi:hypothetical protein
MSDQLLPADFYPALPPVAVNEDALERFTSELDRQLVAFDVRFYEPLRNPAIGMRRHREQPPRKPR